MNKDDSKSDLKTWVGREVFRKEDQRLLRGYGAFIDDVSEPKGTMYMAVLRSPHAHAYISAIDVAAATKLEGVVAVIQGNTAIEIVNTLIKEKFISTLQHAADMGIELHKAELSLKFNLKYIQDQDLIID